jgi:hypothetical protein
VALSCGNAADSIAVSSQGTLYRSASAAHGVLTRRAIAAAMAIAAVLGLIGIGATIAGLTGIAGVASMGSLRSVCYLGLGLLGGGAGALLLLVLDGLRRGQPRAATATPHP